MGKKRKASRQAAAPTGPRDVDPADARLQINSYEDIADSEEEHFINRDKILLDDGPSAKRRKADKEDDMFESSDEEVLGGGDDDSDSSSDGSLEDDDGGPGPRGEDSEAELDDRGYWGSSKKEYYEADALETEADALAEEAEAKRLQQKKLSRMSEADFVFDAGEWAAQDGGAGDEAQAQAEGDGVLTEVLKDVDITSDMGPEEVYRMLQARYPEFDFLVEEFQQLQPRLPKYRQAAEGKPAKSLEVVQYWTLGCYVAALASYFAILTSPSRDGHGQPKALDPASLRDHEVMETLVSCREAWSRVQKFTKSLAARAAGASPAQSHSSADELAPGLTADTPATSKSRPNGADGPVSSSSSSKKKRLDKQQLAKAKRLEESLADLSGLMPKAHQKKKSQRQAAGAQRTNSEGAADDDNSDFGDEDALDARTAEDKAARKKSLRFYTSQIVQKAGKRAGAGRDAGGDMDIPHRERLRDRQARLNAEAERRGQKSSKRGEELGGDDDDDDNDQAVLAHEVRDDEDEYYDMVAHGAQQKKAVKAARHEALKAASKNDQVVEREEVGEDGKRQVTYHILKNKGLAPKRKKEAKNPRVKKRKKFEEKQKKLKSIRAVYGGGEGRGGYQGELSGIKTGLVKSVKLS